LTFKQTWQNSAQTILNTNPVQLDANGCAIVYGSGIYRQILKDALGNTVWDQLTASTNQTNLYWAGQCGGTANAITVVDANFTGVAGQTIQCLAQFTNTGAVTLNPSGYGAIPVDKDTSTGPIALVGGEIIGGTTPANIVTFVFDSVNQIFHINNTTSQISKVGGLALMWPHYNQTSLPNTGAGSAWNAIDPFGNAISCGSTTSQCLQEFQQAVAKNGWAGEVDCGGIPYTGSAAAPTWNGAGQFVIQATQSINFAVAQDLNFKMKGCVINFNVATIPGLVVDSCGSCTYDLDTVVVYNVTSPTASSCGIYIHPITLTDDGFAGLYAGYFRVKAPLAAGSGGNAQGVVCINLDTAGVSGHFVFEEINCSHSTSYGLLIYNETVATQFAGNQTHINDLHGCVTAGVQEGLTTTATAVLANQWYIAQVNSYGATSRGIDTYGSLDQWQVSNINNSEGGLQYGFVTESSANNNLILSGTINGASIAAKLDTGASNMWVGASVGQSCSGALDASAVIVNGIVTKC
jgi:hypothetical protein